MVPDAFREESTRKFHGLSVDPPRVGGPDPKTNVNGESRDGASNENGIGEPPSRPHPHRGGVL